MLETKRVAEDRWGLMQEKPCTSSSSASYASDRPSCQSVRGFFGAAGGIGRAGGCAPGPFVCPPPANAIQHHILEILISSSIRHYQCTH